MNAARGYIFSGLILLAGVLVLAGCGSSGGDDDGIDGTGLVEVGGTAAIGAPIAGATVTLKAGNGARVSATTGVNGKFTLNATGLNGPYLLKVRLANGRSLYSIAAAGGVANIHPFTDLIVRNWFAVRGLDVDAEFDSSGGVTMLPTATQIDEVELAVRAIIGLVLEKYGVSASFNLISGVFDANGTGFDLVLDRSGVVLVSGNVTVVVRDPATGIDGVVVSDVELNTNLAETDVIAPAVPAGVRVIPASANEVILLWTPATDNVAIAGYNVFRQDRAGSVKTPFPVLSDTGLSANTEYCYQVQAIDASGNVSAQSSSVCATTPTVADQTAPSAPANVQAAAIDSGTIALAWQPSAATDVAGYNIYRGSAGAANALVASITGTAFSNVYLAAATEYCYVVKAFDAARNESAASNQSCATTSAPPDQTPPSGARTVTFSSAAYSATESDGTALITVNRTGDVSEAIGVDYTVANGTASAPADFVAASGTLNWSAGDASPKTLRVQIKGDTVAEGAETVSLSLANPSSNLTLGAIPTATLAIENAACSGMLSADVTVDTTLSTCTLVTGQINILNAATLTIAPGVTVVFQNGAAFNVRQDGALTATGTAEKPITLTGQQQTPGFWRGVQFTWSNNVRNELDHVTVEFGGAAINGTANVVMYGTIGLPQRLKIRNSVLSDSSGYGFEISEGAIIDAFENNLITRNTLEPVKAPANVVGKLDAASRYRGNTRDQVSVINNTQVTTDQTWSSLDVPYALGDHQINANLAIQAGARLVFSAGGSLNISTSGSLSAIGTPTNLITFTAAQPTPGYWTGIQYTFSNSVNNALDYVVVEYGGGGGGNGQANVVAFSSALSASRLKLSNGVLRHSMGYGFEFTDGSVVDAFAGNTVTQNQLGAGLVSPDVARVLDSASSYSGNAVDIIRVLNGSISMNQSWSPVNVPYSLGNLTVNARWTVGAPNTFVMRASSAINVSQAGALTANGGANAPIIFTGEQASPGYWDGIQFTFSNTTNNILGYVTVEYAGGTGLNGQGNVILFGSAQSPARASITNCVLRNSQTYGLWYSAGDFINADVATVNSFASNALGNVFVSP